MSRLTYKLTDETKTINGVVLHRIEAIKDIPSQNVKISDKGGWLEKERLADDTPVISDNAWVFDDATVSDNARVKDSAIVSDNAWVYDDAIVSDNARVKDNAEVSGDAMVYGSATISDNAEVCGDAVVCGNAKLRLPRRYKSGHFIGGFDGKDKVTNITGETGSIWWKNQYVLGDYEITEIEDKQIEQADTIEVVEINGKKYNAQDVEKKLAELEEIK